MQLRAMPPCPVLYYPTRYNLAFITLHFATLDVETHNYSLQFEQSYKKYNAATMLYATQHTEI